jgi:hypothetical protein
MDTDFELLEFITWLTLIRGSGELILDNPFRVSVDREPNSTL